MTTRPDPVAEISLEMRRRILLERQMLRGRTGLPRGRKGLLQLIKRLSYIQIDSISVAARAHHHIAWTRLPEYKSGALYDALKSRQVFEYWGHAASFLPMEDYRFYLPLMHRHRNDDRDVARKRLDRVRHLFRPLLDRIRSDGPLTSAELGNEHGKGKGGMWGWKPAKLALEVLMWQGHLMVSERRNFQRVYDLTENVLPSHTCDLIPSERELAEFVVKRAISAYGFASEKQIREMLWIGKRNDTSLGLDALSVTGEIIPVCCHGEKTVLWTSPELLDDARRLRRKQRKLFLLSPFDNVVIQREPLLQVFDFDYRVEIYVPQPKRRFGYYSLPILYGEEMAGRMDVKAHRGESRLEVVHMHVETGFRVDSEFADVLNSRLLEFAELNGCHQVEYDNRGENLSAAAFRLLRKSSKKKWQ